MEGNRSKRNSFFFFSGGSKGTSNSSKEVTKNTFKSPLSKPPLGNTNSFSTSSNETQLKDAIEERTIKSHYEGSEDVNEKLSKNLAQAVAHTAEGPIPTRKASVIMRRPPPPVIDISALNIRSSPDKSNETLSASVSNKTDTGTASPPLKPSEDCNMKAHKRQKSEIDQLMDDLENFEKERRANLEADLSLHSVPSKEDVPVVNSTFDNSSSELNSPIAYVSSLNLGESKQSLITAERDTHERPSNLSSLESTDRYVNSSDQEGDACQDDQFSFTDSHGESVMDLQQISYNNAGKSVPVTSSFRYTSADQPKASLKNNYVVSNNTYQEDQADITAPDFDDRINEEQPRQFRVVNNDKASFYLNEESSTTEDDMNSFSAIESAPFSQSTSSHKALSFESSQTRGLSKDSRSEEKSSFHHDPSTSTDELIPSTVEATPRSQNLSDATQSSGVSGNSMNVQQDKTVRLVSSYVEELRLKYFPTSNSLQPPPDLPHALKSKNNLEQPQNIKVRIRTSSKQIGIKHGKAKQKLLSLETTSEEKENQASDIIGSSPNASTKVDHTREFHELFGKTNLQATENISPDDDDIFLNDIPGDEAYDSDDLMAPLRERKDDTVMFIGEDLTLDGPTSNRIGRSDTVTSYFTRKANRLRSGTLDLNYKYLPKLPIDASMDDYSNQQYEHDYATLKHASVDKDTMSNDDNEDVYYPFNYNGGLHVTNQSSDSD